MIPGEEDYWEMKFKLEIQYYEAKLALEKLVTKARILRGENDPRSWDAEDKIIKAVDKVSLGSDTM